MNRFKYCCLILLLCLFSDSPWFIYHKHNYFFPILYPYLETDFGGTTQLLMDYQDPISLSLIETAFIIKSPLYGLSIDTTLATALSSPSIQHWFGTLPTGQDTLSYSLYAFVFTGLSALLLTTVSYITGLIIGTMHAQASPKIQLVLQLYQEIARSIPLVLIIVICTKQALLLFLLLFSLTQWTRTAQLARIHIQKQRYQPYILDAHYQGWSSLYILYYHHIPYVIEKTKAVMPHMFINYFAIMTSLQYFGIHLFPELPSTGKLVFYMQHYPQAHWLLLPCCIGFICIGLLSLHLYSKQSVVRLTNSCYSLNNSKTSLYATKQ